ncbi:MAG: FHA domain-containing protein [Stomatobaculum sp.]
MELVRCNNGHYYDGSQYSSCPHCSGTGGYGGNETVALDSVAQAKEMTTVAMVTGAVPEEGATLPDAVARATGEPEAVRAAISDDQKTISFYSEDKVLAEQDPVVGWLVCVKGQLYGRDFRLKTGRNFIGRDFSMDVSLEGELTVSRDRHAIVVYEPKQNVFLATPGETKELVYLNGSVVLVPTVMKKNDILQVGEVLLMLQPFCDETFTWKDTEKFTGDAQG